MKINLFKKISIIIVCIFASSLIGCARQFVLKPNNLNQLDAIPAEKARVVFFSPTGMVSQLVQGSLYITDGDNEIGPLTGNSYLIYEADPGQHIFGANINRIRFDFIMAEIEGNKTYYVWNSMVDGFIAGCFPRIYPVKKGSDKMEKLDEWLPGLQESSYNKSGLSYLSNEKNIERDKSRLIKEKEDWLAGKINMDKPKLMPEDGI